MNIIQKPSPNFNSRTQFKPELIVIHIMAGTLDGTDSWFSTPQSQVSAHYGIGLTGEIHQYVAEENRAWHAGRVSKPSFALYKSGINPNDYTIGIEHEGTDLSKNAPEQLQASAELIRDICTRWNIPIDRKHIIAHSQIYSLKPNCPATDKSVIDTIIALAQPPIIPEEQVPITVPKSKLANITEYLLHL